MLPFIMAPRLTHQNVTVVSPTGLCQSSWTETVMGEAAAVSVNVPGLKQADEG